MFSATHCTQMNRLVLRQYRVVQAMRKNTKLSSLVVEEVRELGSDPQQAVFVLQRSAVRDYVPNWLIQVRGL